MLVISRKSGESVVLLLPNGDRIEIKISDHKDGHRVKLAIDAPVTVKILRSELEQRRDLYTSNTEQQYRPNGWEPSNEELRS